MKNKLLLGILFFTLLLDADNISSTFYNDFFGGSDGHFTNGASFNWLEDKKKGDNVYTNMLLSLAHKISLPVNGSKKYNAGISLEQIIITPENIDVKNVQYNDFPYAGYLSISSFLFEWDDDSFNEYRVEIGVMGKYSGAEFIQKKFHKIIKSEQPQGWSTQLGTKYTLNFLLQHGVKAWQRKIVNTLQTDWCYHYGMTAGNFDVSVFTGTGIRIGKNYVQNFNVHYPYLKEEANLLSVDTLKHGFGWSLSSGLETKVLLYSVILDKASSDGYAVHKNILNALAYFSGSIYYNQHKFRLFYEIPTPYIKEDNAINIFGGFEYIYIFK
ncbi:lipid A deacylase LpxR family protein [Sulfurimonas sp. ST-27]|uniref:lipid A deacylase LpxR family protein n=1 Tax=Sulfurimonas sp. ST-27 TaxID=3400152 RepID=UPI003AB318A1